MGGLGPGIGGLEILVIGLVALLVVGPKDLPLLMRKVGKAMARAPARSSRGFSSSVSLRPSRNARTPLAASPIRPDSLPRPPNSSSTMTATMAQCQMLKEPTRCLLFRVAPDPLKLFRRI